MDLRERKYQEDENYITKFVICGATMNQILLGQPNVARVVEIRNAYKV
jgi:hypothetical protein